MSAERRSGGKGRWAGGLVVIVALTFAAGYYVPLYRTHTGLIADYKSLADRVTTLEKDLASARAELAAATSRANELSLRHQGEDTTKEARAARLRRAEAELTTALAASVAKQEVSMGRRGGRVVVALGSAVTESHGRAEVAPAIQASLCTIAETLSSGAFSITVVSLGGSTKAPRGPWDDAATRGAVVARTLETRCHYPSSRIATGARLRAEGGGSGDEPRIDVEIDSLDAPP